MTYRNSKKTILRAIAALAMVAATASFASAATLYSAPLAAGTIGGQELQCHVSNGGNADKTVQLQVVSANGTILSDSGVVVVPSGGMEMLAYAFVPGGRGSCRVQVNGSTKHIRASACAAQLGDGRCVATIDAY